MQLNFSYYKKYSATVIMNRNRRCKIIELCGTTIADTSKCLLQFDLFHLPLPIIVTSAKKKKALFTPYFYFYNILLWRALYCTRFCRFTSKNVFPTISSKCLEQTNPKISQSPWKEYNWLYNYHSFCNITATEVVCMVSVPLLSF